MGKLKLYQVFMQKLKGVTASHQGDRYAHLRIEGWHNQECYMPFGLLIIYGGSSDDPGFLDKEYSIPYYIIDRIVIDGEQIALFRAIIEIVENQKEIDRLCGMAKGLADTYGS